MKFASRSLAALLSVAIVTAAAAPAEARGRGGNGAAVVTGLAAGLLGALAVTAMSGNAQAAPAYAPSYPYGYQPQPQVRYVPARPAYRDTYRDYGYASYGSDPAYDRHLYGYRGTAYRDATYGRRPERVVKVVTNPDTGERICKTNYGRLSYC